MAGFDEITIALPDAYRAYARFWPPAGGKPRGAVLYHHGIQSHCAWYESSPAALADAGFAVLQVDRRGSGRNSQDRGHAESAEQLIADHVAARDELLRRTGLRVYHIVGVSWGGKLAAAAHAAEPDSVASLTMITPGLFPKVGVSKETATQIGFAMLYEPLRPFDIPLNDPEMFTSNPKWQAFHRDDPLTLRQCTAGFYLASRRMDRIVGGLPQASPVPTHLLLAGDERIVENHKTRSFVEALGWAECRIATYDGARHSLEFEPCRETFLRDLIAFLEGVA